MKIIKKRIFKIFSIYRLDNIRGLKKKDRNLEEEENKKIIKKRILKIFSIYRSDNIRGLKEKDRNLEEEEDKKKGRSIINRR